MPFIIIKPLLYIMLTSVMNFTVSYEFGTVTLFVFLSRALCCVG